MNWLQKMMYGRNGADQLSLALVIFSMALSLLGSIFGWGILVTVAWVPLVFSFFRMFSRNIYKRRAENQKFLGVWWKGKAWFSGMGRHAAESRVYRFYSCPQCRQKLRVPRGKGKISIRCPKCGTEFVKKT